ncbi:MAG: histidinol dehydrogenase [Proteobacteria bacterium]|nr:histidinol dehydrogenase [Pseudomonadota bacterium]
MRLQISTWIDLDAGTQQALLQRPATSSDASIRDSVTRIIGLVRAKGDPAIRALTAQHDDAHLDLFGVDDDELAAAEAELSFEALAAIDLAIANVRRFHAAQLPGQISVETMPGVRCERLSHAIDAVGLYVPAGTAPLPSAAIMLAVPAVIAGCPTRIMCTPPRPDGRADPAVLVAALRSGVSDIFKIGGAQAIAAMAYGTESVPKVCKIFGPGNTWVTCAKKIVSNDSAGAAIDMPAGPSELLVIADRDASAEFVAADLLSQAEHGVDSQVMLLTTDADFARQVQAAIETQLKRLSRVEIVLESLANSQVIIVQDIAMAVAISNRYAPEHLILQVTDPRDALSGIRNAGSVFIGPWTPESVGDYCSGTNHVLPTNGFARSHSGLGVEQFQRNMTVQELTSAGLAGIAAAVMELAGLEGLDAHAAAVRCRLDAST